MNSNDNESAGASGNSDLDHQNVDDCFSSFYTEVQMADSEEYNVTFKDSFKSDLIRYLLSL